jgi:hypothetical protein
MAAQVEVAGRLLAGGTSQCDVVNFTGVGAAILYQWNRANRVEVDRHTLSKAALSPRAAAFRQCG